MWVRTNEMARVFPDWQKRDKPSQSLAWVSNLPESCPSLYAWVSNFSCFYFWYWYIIGSFYLFEEIKKLFERALLSLIEGIHKWCLLASNFSIQKLWLYFDCNIKDTPKLMLEIQNPSPAPLVRSLLFMAERAVPVIIPAANRGIVWVFYSVPERALCR